MLNKFPKIKGSHPRGSNQSPAKPDIELKPDYTCKYMDMQLKGQNFDLLHTSDLQELQTINVVKQAHLWSGPLRKRESVS